MFFILFPSSVHLWNLPHHDVPLPLPLPLLPCHPPSGWLLRRRLPGKVKDCLKGFVLRHPRNLRVSLANITICVCIFCIMLALCCIFSPKSEMHHILANRAGYCIPMVTKVNMFNYWRMEKTGGVGENIIASRPNIMIMGQNCGGCSRGLLRHCEVLNWFRAFYFCSCTSMLSQAEITTQRWMCCPPLILCLQSY